MTDNKRPAGQYPKIDPHASLEIRTQARSYFHGYDAALRTAEEYFGP